MAKVKFGQYVRLKVETEDRQVIFETDSLRVDFDIYDVSGWVRGKIDIYNLSPRTNGLLMNGKNFVSIHVSLHGGEETLIADRLYVSNAANVFAVPNSITSLYCYSKLKKAVLEKQVNIEVQNPSLLNSMDKILADVIFQGRVIYKQFPDNYVEAIPDNPLAKFEGSVLSHIDIMSKQYRFIQFIDGEDLIIMYRVNPKNQSATSLQRKGGSVQINSNNMRSNPKIGPATIDIHSNLDPRIKPAAVIDIDNIISASPDMTAAELQTAEDILKDGVAGFRKYQVWKVQHKGSNFSKDWSTFASGVAPTKGFTTSNNEYNWFK